ncbi:MAG: hypothetical protein DME93_05900 [Verrucomicrobia bacterium]|nr:MAG: hypothetical protein DME93_05900 [Verrucomicrobiota bacterium]
MPIFFWFIHALTSSVMRSSRLPCFKVRDSQGAVEPSRIDIARRGGCAPYLLVFFARYDKSCAASRP